LRNNCANNGVLLRIVLHTGIKLILNTIGRLVEPTLTVLSHLTSYHSLTFRFET